jgi:protein O-mannosyl-transferase
VIATTNPDQRLPSQRLVFWAALLPALCLTACVYYRGLYGVFLFDDFANLPALGAFGPVDNWTAFWRYITSGTADPTGRPLALLSFLLDAHNWPADPYPFKRTSLILHLVNGALLALLLRRLGRTAYGTSTLRIDLAAALGAALWLLHPLFVSTTLYVVQREAMLPATFTLIGLLGYVRGRDFVAQGRRGGVWLAAGSIGISTVLAIACKANGILLPMLAWLIETILLAPAQRIPDAQRMRFAWMRRLALNLPSALLLIWLAMQGLHFVLYGISSVRPWTLAERLLTEARIVCDYLGSLWLPHPYTAGLFNDAVTVSSGLLEPPSTLAAIVFLTALLVAAIALRRRAPALALAVLFYFAGHLLESTVIPLELYYEHRNYLPAMLMFWPLALWLTGDGQTIAIRRVLAVALPLMLAGMTFLNADLWGDAQQQALVWAAKNPGSPRAQAYAAAAERARGRPDLAAARMQRTHVEQIEDVQIALNQVGAECELGTVDAKTLARAQAALRTSRTAGRLYYDWISEAIQGTKTADACQGLGVPEIGTLLDAMEKNSNMRRFGGWRQDNLGLRANLALAQHDPDTALKRFNQALEADPRPAAALAQAAQLGSAGYPAEGLAHLDHFDALPKPATHWNWSMATLHAWLLRRQGFMEGEIAHLRGVLEQDVRDARGKEAERPHPPSVPSPASQEKT